MDADLSQLRAKIVAGTNENRRIRIVWLYGAPRVGKSWRCRLICEQMGWRYFNYITDPEGLPSIHGREGTIVPEATFGEWLSLFRRISEPVIVMDEIEPLLAQWSPEQRGTFIRQLTRTPDLPCGVLLITRWKLIKPILKTVIKSPEQYIEI